MRANYLFSAMLVACAVEQVSADKSALASRVDRHGDPLPAGAVQRFGTSRFWSERAFMTASVSPDGKLIVSGHEYGSLRLWDASTGKQLRVFEGSDSLLAAVFSPDGKLLATRSGGTLFRDNSIRIWDAASWTELRSFAGFKLKRDRGNGSGSDHLPFFELAFTPDGKSILTGPGDNEDKTHILSLWHVETGQLSQQFQGHQANVLCFSIAPDGQTIVSGSADKTVRLWNLATGKEMHQFKDHADEIRAVAFSPDSKLVAAAAGFEDGGIRVWEVATGKLVHKLRRFIGNRHANAIAFTPDGKTLLAGDGSGRVTLWNVDNGRIREEIDAVHPQAIRMLRLSRDGQRLLVLGGYDNFLNVWDLANKRPLLPEIKHHFGGVSGLALSGDGKWLASSGADNQAWIWDFAEAKLIRQLPPEAGEINLLTFLDSTTLYAGGFGGVTPRLWEVPSGRVVKSLERFAIAAAFSPDGKWFANGWPREVRLFDRQSGRLTANHKLRQNNGVIRKSLAFTPDSRHLLWADQEGLGVIDTATGKIVKRIEDQDFDFFTMSPDGQMLASSGPFALWDWQRGVRLTRFPARTKHVVSPQEMRFSNDGRWVAAAGSDNVLRVWEIATGQEVRNYRPYIQEQGWSRFAGLAFGPDGRTVMTCGTDAQILQWDLTGRLHGGKLAPATLAADEVQRCWEALAGADAEAAYDALWALASNPQASLPHLQKRLVPVDGVADAQIAQLIRDLESTNFEQRDRATREIAKLEELAEFALEKASKAKSTLETSRRIDLLLEKVRSMPLSPEKLQQVRALTILEQIGPEEGRPLVERLAKGAPTARQTREAQRVLRLWTAGSS